MSKSENRETAKHVKELEQLARDAHALLEAMEPHVKYGDLNLGSVSYTQYVEWMERYYQLVETGPQVTIAKKKQEDQSGE